MHLWVYSILRCWNIHPWNGKDLNLWCFPKEICTTVYLQGFKIILSSYLTLKDSDIKLYFTVGERVVAVISFNILEFLVRLVLYKKDLVLKKMSVGNIFPNNIIEYKIGHFMFWAWIDMEERSHKSSTFDSHNFN